MSAASESASATTSQLELFQAFQRSPFRSVKHDSYFQVYEGALGKYVGQPVTLVEVGVLNGGSLFMWRDYLGPQARIIGVELNPLARRWESQGFEIFIGSQSDPAFWKDFYERVGPIDVLIDDGGHTNAQQIVTSHWAIRHIRDGGTLIVEDVHTSYFRNFGNPYRYSFVNFARRVVDAINSRFPAVKEVGNDYGGRVFSVCFYESIVVFNIDSRRCFASSPVENRGETFNAVDMRVAAMSRLDPVDAMVYRVEKRLAFLSRIPFLRRVNEVFPWLHRLVARKGSGNLKMYFD